MTSRPAPEGWHRFGTHAMPDDVPEDHGLVFSDEADEDGVPHWERLVHLPPDTTGVEVIFDDDFHDLLHSVRECVGYPGGRLKHLTLAWEYQWSEQVRAVTLCRLGRHDWMDSWQRRTLEDPFVHQVVCRACGRRPRRTVALP